MKMALKRIRREILDGNILSIDGFTLSEFPVGSLKVLASFNNKEVGKVSLSITCSDAYPIRPPTITLYNEACDDIDVVAERFALVCPEISDWIDDVRKNRNLLIFRTPPSSKGMMGEWTPLFSFAKICYLISTRLSDRSFSEAVDGIVQFAGNGGPCSFVRVEFGGAGDKVPQPAGPLPDGTRISELFILIDPNWSGGLSFLEASLFREIQVDAWKEIHESRAKNRGVISWRVQDEKCGVDARYIVVSAPYCGGHEESASALEIMFSRLLEAGWEKFHIEGFRQQVSFYSALTSEVLKNSKSQEPPRLASSCEAICALAREAIPSVWIYDKNHIFSSGYDYGQSPGFWKRR